MFAYIDFLRAASKETPSWWWFVTVVWAVLSAVPGLSHSATAMIIHYWYWWTIFLLVFLSVGITGGSFKLYQNQQAAHRIQISDLKREQLKEWDAKVSAAKEQNDERSIPDVIRELREERGKWMQAENMDRMSARGTGPDENDCVARLKGKRDERLVRKAYKVWKADKFE